MASFGSLVLAIIDVFIRARQGQAGRLLARPLKSFEVVVTSHDGRAIHSAARGALQSRAIGLPQVLAIAGYVGGFAGVLNFSDVPPRVGLAAVEIGEAIDVRQLPAGQ